MISRSTGERVKVPRTRTKFEKLAKFASGIIKIMNVLKTSLLKLSISYTGQAHFEFTDCWKLPAQRGKDSSAPHRDGCSKATVLNLRHRLLEQVVGAPGNASSVLQLPCRSLVQVFQLVILILQLGCHITQDTVHLGNKHCVTALTSNVKSSTKQIMGT